MELEEVSCGDPGCFAAGVDLLGAVGLGWSVVGGKPYCPLHAYSRVREAKKAAMRAQVEAVQREALDKIAKTGLTGREYAKWDEFQGDLADYHKKTGKLAPKPLRLMSPWQWLYQVTKNGPIVIEDEVKRLEEVKARATNRLKGI